MYPPEILNYGMRSSGMAFYTFIVNETGLFNAFTSRPHEELAGKCI
jgi:hypothetical protein